MYYRILLNTSLKSNLISLCASLIVNKRPNCFVTETSFHQMIFVNSNRILASFILRGPDFNEKVPKYSLPLSLFLIPPSLDKSRIVCDIGMQMFSDHHPHLVLLTIFAVGSLITGEAFTGISVADVGARAAVLTWVARTAIVNSCR